MQKRKLLVVDDQAINRKILQNILKDTYEITLAENGLEALEILRKADVDFSAILLDLIMPVMGGLELLAIMKEDENMSLIPVIVVSQAEQSETEHKALDLGARDFISKPFNPNVLCKRLSNLIELYESNERIDVMERDSLTGIYNKDAFCRVVRERLNQDFVKEYILVLMDIEQFKLINDTFGALEGDRLLQYIASELTISTDPVEGIVGRIGGDIFACLVPDEEDMLEKIVGAARLSLAKYSLEMKVHPKFGVFRIDDRKMPVSTMCERALLAAENIKGKYGLLFAFYDDTIRQKLLDEQQMSNEMVQALENGEFEIYLQPKYELVSERIAGAEALVRWRHPVKGLLSAADFIPFFEHNGFITELDLYVWDKTCELIASWIKRGDCYIPISVNMSRKDIYRDNLVELLMGILNKHGLKPQHLHLEITESAYTENQEQLLEIIGRLKSMGFVIEMDDFGKGYSSLNMLSELPIDILKLDMRFIQHRSRTENRRNIISFIISLAKWMNLSIVAEGVESEEQIELLRTLDCTYVQGYYFARPMPCSEFTEILFQSQLSDPVVCSEEIILGTTEAEKKKGRKVILIADGDAKDRDVLKNYLSDKYVVVEKENGREVYQYISENFDITDMMILDWNLSEMSLENMMSKFVVNELYQDIPVIVTNQDGENTEAAAFSMGASDFLEKPYQEQVVLHRVQNALEKSAIRTLEREKRMISKMKKLALEAKLDQLTGLYNRSEMENQVREFFTENSQRQGMFIMLDIDDFKIVNDTMGHAKGDEAIRKVASLLISCFREEDIICRMGGDEFAVFVKVKFADADIDSRMEMICRKLRFQMGDLHITCSLGVSEAPKYGNSYQELYERADSALLMAKRSGKNQYQLYGGGQDVQSPVLFRNMDWILDESSNGVYIIDAVDHTLLYLNEAVCRILGKTKKECLGRPCYELFSNTNKLCDFCIPLEKLSDEYQEKEIIDTLRNQVYIIKTKRIKWGGRLARIQYLQDNTRQARMIEGLKKKEQELREALAEKG